MPQGGVAAGGGGVDREGALGGEAMQIARVAGLGAGAGEPSSPKGCTPTKAPIMLRFTQLLPTRSRAHDSSGRVSDRRFQYLANKALIGHSGLDC